ncbi:MAG: glycosyltransferase family 2 protein [Candidatus Hodarchaeales archaeon]|jgi:dolichol-phosphate mannosyltransferase
MESDVSISRYSREKFIDYKGIIDKNDITIVIPTLNEALGIGQVIEDVINEGYFKILIIDGYSSDETVEIVNGYDVQVLNQIGKGKTGAIKTCINHVKTPYFVVIDGDTTYDPKDIVKFLPHIRYYNQIIGARDKGRDNISKINRFGNWIINTVFNLMFGTSLSDVCSGLYALNTQFAKGLTLETQGFDVEVEIAAQAADSGSITQVPISFSKRVGLQKLHPWKDGTKILLTTLKLARTYNAISLYSLISTLTIIPGSLLLIWVFLETLNQRWHNGMALLGIMFTLLATQSFTISTIASQQRRLEQRLLRKMQSGTD